MLPLAVSVTAAGGGLLRLPVVPLAMFGHVSCPPQYIIVNILILNNIIICIESTCANYRCKTMRFKVLKDCVTPSYASQWFGPLAPICQTPHTLAIECAGTTLKLSTYQSSSLHCI